MLIFLIFSESMKTGLRLQLSPHRHVSAPPELGVATAYATKKMIPRRFPDLSRLECHWKRHK